MTQIKSKIIIAIDGPAGVGKGTLAKNLAKYLGCEYLETGLLYRAVAFHMMEEGLDLNNPQLALECARFLKPDDLRQPLLKTEEVGNGASKVSIHPTVRSELLEFQRRFAEKGGVLDGRDIGSVVCPWADFKIFLTASLEARVERRVKELHIGTQTGITKEALTEMVSAKMFERDSRDRDRSVAPLVPAKDAIIIDTSSMNADEVFNRVVELINQSPVSL
jgi:cytidylate kinase